MSESVARLCPLCGGAAKVERFRDESGDGFPDSLMFDCAKCGVLGWIEGQVFGPRRINPETVAFDVPMAS